MQVIESSCLVLNYISEYMRLNWGRQCLQTLHQELHPITDRKFSNGTQQIMR